MSSQRTRLARFRRFTSLSLAIGVAALAAACSGSPVAVTDVSRFRVTNALAAGSTVDVLLDGRVVASGLAMRATTALALVEAGAHVITLRATGTNEVLLTLPVDIAVNSDVSLVAAGNAGDTRAILLVDDPFAPRATTPQVRFVNAAPNAASIDLFVAANEIDPAASPGVAPTVSGVAFGTATAFLGIPFGPSTVVTTIAGTRTTVPGVEPFNQDFEEGTSTVILAPTSGGGGAAFFVVPGSGAAT